MGTGKEPKSRGKKPESSAPLTYSSYLKVDELISLQHPLSNPVAHDEMLFIVIHQTYELWFKQVIYETHALLRCLDQDNLIQSYRILNRIDEIFAVLVKQVDILETMSPVEFNRFRSNINPASGFQSAQFREFEVLAGASPASYGRLSDLGAEWKDKIAENPNPPNLRETLFQLLKSRGLLNEISPQAIETALLKIYHDPNLNQLHKLCESLINFDEKFLLWRFRHLQMVERMIGMKMGTGGSLGVPYLAQTLRKKFFPELWDVRTKMDGNETY